MTPADAAALVRAWFVEHFSRIERALAWYGIESSADRADLTQEVLMIGYQALVRGDVIDNPRAWLRECARKQASNFRRKALRRALTSAVELTHAMPTPEQIVAHKELLRRLVGGLDEKAQALVFDVRIGRLARLRAAHSIGDDEDVPAIVAVLHLRLLQARLLDPERPHESGSQLSR
jgi:DNA-directed RNA polymerase specialized sigma24 family protein